MIGQVLEGRYKITGKIGAGGMGTVYSGVHTGTGRRVAIKVISQQAAQMSEVAVKRFRREARTAGTIETKHIVEIIDVSTDPESGAPYMVMEMMAGEDVKELCKRVGPLPWRTALSIAIQSCRGLDKAHEAGVIHRDIKPANLFLDQREGEQVTIKVLDFGVAKIKEQDINDSVSGYDITATGMMLGSPLYMSPEQARGLRDIDHRSDLWSLGVVLYRMLAGRAPFQDAESLGDLIVSICSAATPPLQDFAPWVPHDIAAIVHACLVPDRARRFGSAREMSEVLLSVLPDGETLTKSMLVGISDAERDLVATRFDVSGSGADQLELTGDRPSMAMAEPLPSTPSQAESVPATETAETSADVNAATVVQAPAKSRTGIYAAIGIGVVVGGYFTLQAVSGDSESPSEPALTAPATDPAPQNDQEAAQPEPAKSAAPEAAASASSAPSASASASASAAAASASAAPSAAAAPTGALPTAAPRPQQGFGRPAAPKATAPTTPKPVAPPPAPKVPSGGDDPFGGRK